MLRGTGLVLLRDTISRATGPPVLVVGEIRLGPYDAVCLSYGGRGLRYSTRLVTGPAAIPGLGRGSFWGRC